VFPISVVWGAVAGALLASFTSLWASRVKTGESVVRPARSYCPACRATLAWYELVPVVSFLALRGRCRRCGACIPARELVVEVVGAAMGALVVATWGVTPTALLYGLFAFGLMGVALVDLDTCEVPLAGVALMGAVWLAAFLARRFGAWLVLPRDPVQGLVVMIAASAFAALVTRGRYGGGDWLLGALMGLYLGPYFGLVAWFLANALAAPLALLRRRGRSVPFAPALAVASVVMMLPQAQMLWLHVFPYRFFD
jgi:leader peptidase (prepilin peptidase)/N-methyltransferase